MRSDGNARAGGGERLRGLRLHVALAQDRNAEHAARQLAAHEEIGDHVDVRAERQVLVDGLDARRLGLRRRGKMPLGAVEDDAPGACRHAAGDDLDQRRFAGAVVAEQRHDLAATDVEADAAQRLDRAEMLGDRVEPEQGRFVARGLAHRSLSTSPPLAKREKTEA